jgi:tRNA nucleotidyltransferase (CCA-adding enzyme)
MFKLLQMKSDHWEHFEHKADIGIRGFGDTLAAAFTQAALAMTAVVTEIERVQPVTSINIDCSEAENDTLLYDWLNALIYEMSTRKMLFSEFDLRIDSGNLTAAASGEAIDIERHQPAVEIKGATFTELAVYQDKGQWIAQCVIDV